MKLGVQVGLGPGHIVLDGDPAPSPPKGHSPPNFGPYLLWPNGCMDQDGTWHGGRPQPRRLCVRWGPSPSPKKGAEPPPQFSAHFECRQTTGCIKMSLGMLVCLSPGDFVLHGNPPLSKKGAEPPNFPPMFIIVIVISLEHCAVVIGLFVQLELEVQVQVLLLFAFYF